MATKITRLGYGESLLTEDVFTRMLNNIIFDGEEIRLDQPGYGQYENTFSYMGLAGSGSLEDSPVWSVIRKTIDFGSRTNRIQFRTNITWSQRSQGWI